jgi:NitT/TauT family transport system permease protein
MKKVLERILFYALLIVAWGLVARAGFLPARVLPSPRSVLLSLGAGFQDGSIPSALLMSLKRIVVGYTVSIVGGILLGAVIGRSARAENTFGSLILGLQTLPSLCWMPAALLWFGPTNTAIVFVVVMGSVFSIAISTLDGVKNIPPRYLQAAQSLGSRGWHLYTDVIAPATLPAIAQGLKQAWTFAWRSLLGGELLFVTLGLGNLLQSGRQRNDISLVAAVMVLITLIGLLADRLLFSPIEKHVRARWGLE